MLLMAATSSKSENRECFDASSFPSAKTDSNPGPNSQNCFSERLWVANSNLCLKNSNSTWSFRKPAGLRFAALKNLARGHSSPRWLPD